MAFSEVWEGDPYLWCSAWLTEARFQRLCQVWTSSPLMKMEPEDYSKQPSQEPDI